MLQQQLSTREEESASTGLDYGLCVCVCVMTTSSSAGGGATNPRVVPLRLQLRDLLLLLQKLLPTHVHLLRQRSKLLERKRTGAPSWLLTELSAHKQVEAGRLHFE